jgi:hypothetical protein
MSNTQYAFLKKSNIPTQAALQNAIDTLGFDLKIDPALDLLNDTGFSPCVLTGISEVGFELWCENSADVTEDDEEFRQLAGENDSCLTLTWGGRSKDLACAMIVSCALVKDFGAVVSYEGDAPDSLDDMLGVTAECVEVAMRENEDEDRDLPGADDAIHDAAAGNVQISLSGIDGNKIAAYLNAPNYFELNRARMALMELWVAGTISAQQSKQLVAVDEALFKLKSK